jgi:hypothetical protein
LPADGLDLRNGLSRRRFVQIVHHYPCAVARQSQRDLLADATARTGHQRNSAIQLSHFSFSFDP